MTKQDLTDYSDAELSLHVFNDESLYCLRRYPAALAEAISNLFEYTDEQEATLWEDVAADADEE